MTNINLSQDPVQILVIDDEEFLLEAIKDLLRPLHANVECSSSAQDALDRLSRKPFDVVITDLGMPEVSGEKLIAEIEKRCDRPLKIVLMTGSLNLPSSPLARGEYRLLQKPFDRGELVEVLKGWVPSRGK